MRIDVWSDIVCPFCHLGRRHLELALEQFEHADEVGVVWHSFQLDREAPATDDAPVLDRIAEKYGSSREQMVAQHERMAQDAAAPYRAAGKWKVFAADAEIVPGIRSVAAPGHTPGHSAYLLESKAQQLLIWGDIVHSHAVQFQRPEVAIEFDVDKKLAVATRRALFARTAKAKLLVAGMHLPFPGLGHVRSEGKGYAWVPVEFSPIRSDR
ncbi:MAG: DsbA family protein [Proteobacteria bacterium]|nr:DsbA family protein [Pseudomonadota bacterium]